MEKIGKFHKIKNQNSMKYKSAICFMTADPLHYGHIRLLERASKIAEKVYAVTESDKIIRKNKGRKAFTSQENRVNDLKGIKYVSEVGMRTTYCNRRYWARRFKADVLVLGSDWKHKKWAGRKLGIPIVYFDRTKDISSTDLRKKYGMGIPLN